MSGAHCYTAGEVARHIEAVRTGVAGHIEAAAAAAGRTGPGEEEHRREHREAVVASGRTAVEEVDGRSQVAAAVGCNYTAEEERASRIDLEEEEEAVDSSRLVEGEDIGRAAEEGVAGSILPAEAGVLSRANAC